MLAFGVNCLQCHHVSNNYYMTSLFVNSLSLYSRVTSRFGALVNMCVEVLNDVMDITDSGEQFE